MIPLPLFEKISEKNIPISASFELTWRCNLQCIHCYQYQPRDNEFTTDEIKGILDQLAQMGCLYISFTGGEPLMREDFREIAEYACAKNFAITLQTNGTYITDTEASIIRRLNFLRVCVSLLGAEAQTHDGITKVRGSFQKVIAAIKLLKSKGVRVLSMTTLMRENSSEINKIREMANHLDIESVISPIITPKNDGGETPLKLRITDEEIKRYYTDMSIVPFCEGEFFEIKPGDLICGCGKTTLGINPHGEIYPCISFPVSVGSLKEQSLEELWLRATPFLRQIRSLQPLELKGCSDCNLAKYCLRCAALAYQEDGDFTGVSHECCRIAKIQKEVIMNEEKKIPEAEIDYKEV